MKRLSLIPFSLPFLLFVYTTPSWAGSVDKDTQVEIVVSANFSARSATD
ncbi:hypothetical protein LMG28614_02110 [Paraburkholderia ultramafica]|uniref:Uncharacterized protein n=1 Tax=Paraburkholderia ultramafica TaxID=1544867 RepID=A0A6S7B4K4_9BURK|nr:hypothetical protein LMG28614_02110 [Paraburkholderia ultramafica]